MVLVKALLLQPPLLVPQATRHQQPSLWQRVVLLPLLVYLLLLALQVPLVVGSLRTPLQRLVTCHCC
jgi:hypothetical protein